MDLSSLKATLGLRDVKTSAHTVAAEMLPPPSPAAGPTVVDEIFARHRNSTQPESQQLCLILSSILEVIAAQGLQPTPAALFAALMATLRSPDTTAATPELAATMCNILSLVLVRVPTSVLRPHAVPAVQTITTLIEGTSTAATAPIVVRRHAIPCLTQILAAMGPSDWPAMSRGFSLTLAACLDHQPKLRKRAQSGVVDVLAALQSMPTALGPASEAVLGMCQRVLPLPAAAAQAAANAPNKKRQAAEAAITAAVADALHLLGLLQQSMSLLSGMLVSLCFVAFCFLLSFWPGTNRGVMSILTFLYMRNE